MNFNYYVYGVFDSYDDLVYIGKGIGDRVDSHCKGNSSSSYLNGLYFNGENLYTRKLSEGLSEQQAILKEAQLIHGLRPEGNLRLPKITQELVNKAYEDERLKPSTRKEEISSERFSFPLVKVLRSPNYNCMHNLRFPCELPLEWCDGYYRIHGKDLVALGCVLQEDMSEEDTLCIPNYCFT